MARRISKKKKEKIGRVLYGVILTVFAVTLTAIAVICLSDWNKYLIAYEKAQPDTVVASYMEELEGTKWKSEVAEAVAGMEHPFQTDEECEAVINQMLGETIQYSQSYESSTGKLIYNIYCNGNPVGQFQLERDYSQINTIDIGVVELLSTSDTFWFVQGKDQLCPWRVTGEVYDISGFTFTSSVTVTVPSNYTVTLNGRTVGPEYITERDIHYDVLEPYYAEFPGLPTKVKYHVDNIFGKLDPVIYDTKGNVVTIDPEKDDSQFMEACSAAETEALSSFAYNFVSPYANFTGTKNIWGNYGALKQYVKDGSELQQRMDLFIEGGADYMNFYSVSVSDIQVNSVYSLGGGFYVINVTYKTVNYAEYKTVEETCTKRIIACMDESGILAVSVE